MGRLACAHPRHPGLERRRQRQHPRRPRRRAEDGDDPHPNAGNLDKLLADVEQVKNEKLRAKLAAAREQILQNREMVRLDTDLPLPTPVEQLHLAPRYDELIAVIQRCEFRSMLIEIKAEAKHGAPKAAAAAAEAQEDLFPF